MGLEDGLDLVTDRLCDDPRALLVAMEFVDEADVVRGGPGDCDPAAFGKCVPVGVKWLVEAAVIGELLFLRRVERLAEPSIYKFVEYTYNVVAELAVTAQQPTAAPARR